MINSILIEANRYLNSNEYQKTLDSISSEYSLNPDNYGYLYSVLSSIVSGEIPEDKFVAELRNASDLNRDTINSLVKRCKELILVPFKARIAKLVIDKQQEAFSGSVPHTAPLSVPPVDKLLRKETPAQQPEELIHFVPQQPVEPAAPVAPSFVPRPRPQAQERLDKSSILEGIENPPRTVMKKYVLEHEPITDPDHLIDDTVDQRTKLESHYND